MVKSKKRRKERPIVQPHTGSKRRTCVCHQTAITYVLYVYAVHFTDLVKQPKILGGFLFFPFLVYLKLQLEFLALSKSKFAENCQECEPNVDVDWTSLKNSRK